MQTLVSRDIYGERWRSLSEVLLLIKTQRHSRWGYIGEVSLVGCFLYSVEVELNIKGKTQIGVGGLGGGGWMLKGKNESWVGGTVVRVVWGYQGDNNRVSLNDFALEIKSPLSNTPCTVLSSPTALKENCL